MAVREPPMRPDQLRSRSGRPRACPGGLEVASASSIICGNSLVISEAVQASRQTSSACTGSYKGSKQSHEVALRKVTMHDQATGTWSAYAARAGC